MFFMRPIGEPHLDRDQLPHRFAATHLGRLGPFFVRRCHNGFDNFLLGGL